MVSAIKDLLTPEAQRGAHHWAATFAGHLAIGVPGWLALHGIGPTIAVVAVGLVYALAWELPQYRRSDRSISVVWDCLLDWVGAVLGAMIAAFLWHQQGWWAAASIMAALVITCAGARQRSGNQPTPSQPCIIKEERHG